MAAVREPAWTKLGTVEPPLRLRPPRLSDEPDVLAAQRELARERFEFAFRLDEQPFDEFVQRVDDHAHGRSVGPGMVESTWLLAVVGNDVVGRSSIRFALDDFLRREGGHIGYAVRPQHRRRGYATEMAHAVLAHGLAMESIRATAPADVQVGPADVLFSAVPVSDTPENVRAAETATRGYNERFLDVMLAGRYSDTYLAAAGADAPAFTDADLMAIGGPLDFGGANI